jgi:hypothetical protein
MIVGCRHACSKSQHENGSPLHAVVSGAVTGVDPDIVFR